MVLAVACLAIAATLVFVVPTDSLALRARGPTEAIRLLAARSPGQRAPGAVSDKRPRQIAAAPSAMLEATVAAPLPDPLAPAVLAQNDTMIDIQGGPMRLDSQPVRDIESLPRFSAHPTIHPIAPLPEPSTWSAMLSGFGMIGLALRGRRRRPVLTGVENDRA